MATQPQQSTNSTDQNVNLSGSKNALINRRSSSSNGDNWALLHAGDDSVDINGQIMIDIIASKIPDGLENLKMGISHRKNCIRLKSLSKTLSSKITEHLKKTNIPWSVSIEKTVLFIKNCNEIINACQLRSFARQHGTIVSILCDSKGFSVEFEKLSSANTMFTAITTNNVYLNEEQQTPLTVEKRTVYTMVEVYQPSNLAAIGQNEISKATRDYVFECYKSTLEKQSKELAELQKEHDVQTKKFFEEDALVFKNQCHELLTTIDIIKILKDFESTHGKQHSIYDIVDNYYEHLLNDPEKTRNETETEIISCEQVEQSRDDEDETEILFPFPTSSNLDRNQHFGSKPTLSHFVNIFQGKNLKRTINEQPNNSTNQILNKKTRKF